jgi:nucleoid-associated protein YgaU
VTVVPIEPEPPAADVAETAPEPSIDAGAAGADAVKVALANPVNIAVAPRIEEPPAVQPPAEQVAVAAPEPASDPQLAVDAGAEAAKVAAASPVEVSQPAQEAAISAPEPAPEPAVDAAAIGANAATAALANPVTVEPPETLTAAAEPEPAVTAEPGLDAMKAGATAAMAAIDKPVAVAVAEPEKTIPTLRGVQMGEEDLMRFATGKVIIRRGDTLWDIAKRVYGSGLKYRTIYRANRNVIRRPGRIYPGQVFELPMVYD